FTTVNSFAIRVRKSRLQIPGSDGTHTEQVGRLRSNLRSEIPKRNAVIENGNASPVHRNDQIRRARMNLYVVHPHRREIANAHPVAALIKGREHSEVRTRVKQFRIYRVFAHCLDGVSRMKIARA